MRFIASFVFFAVLSLSCASSAETDDERDRVRALFEDDTCTTLNPALKRPAIRNEISKLRKATKREEMLDLLERAHYLVENKPVNTFPRERHSKYRSGKT